MTGLLQRFFNVRREEVAPILAAAFYFFCVLTALMLLRPARDALGMQRGMDAIRWLFIGTAVVTFFVTPAFGFLVSRFRRLVFVGITYGFFALSLVGFYLLLTLTPQAVGERSGQVFYVWFSVFNLFATMVFWALMADRFSLEQSKRIFGVIAVGGTLGAIFGPWLASLLAKPLGTPALLLVSAGFLILAIGAAGVVARLKSEAAPGERVAPPVDEQTVIGGKAWEGVRAVFRSKYLLGISGFVLMMTILSTFIYVTRLQMVAAMGTDLDTRTGLFAQLDLLTQVTTLVLQAVVAGHLMKRLGVATALALLPFVVAMGFIGLAIIGSLAAIAIFDAIFKALQRAVARPGRETLFTVVSREEKYKSKAFTDTFVYRGGDVIGAWTESFLGKLGMGLAGLASVAVPLALVWGSLALWLGRRQGQLAAERSAQTGA
ncbi:MAG: MFS transporter [Gemmatimonadales bacterium]|nr:MFS transporter [Gemmatimonadales bacterium]